MGRVATGMTWALAASCAGCALEGGFGGSGTLNVSDSALRARVGATFRTSRGNGAFGGGELNFANAPTMQIRSLQLRAGYAWWFRRGRDELGLEVSVLGGYGASPFGADRAKPLDGYHLTAPAFALPVVLWGGGDISSGFVVGSVTVLFVPEVSLNFWFSPDLPADHPNIDVTATANLRFWFRSDLATADTLRNTHRVR